MKKSLTIIIAIIILIIIAFFVFNSYIYHEKQGDQVPASDPKDATYVVDRQVVTLVNGISEIPAAAGSASKIITRYFGNEIVKDLDGDGSLDTAFLVTQETGGTGLFYYVVAALNKEGGYEGTQGLFLGDRIAPQNTVDAPGRSFLVTYADRAPGEDFSIQPSVGKSIRLLLDVQNMQFGEVVQDFEGESNLPR
jgi:hypothetical protein